MVVSQLKTRVRNLARSYTAARWDARDAMYSGRSRWWHSATLYDYVQARISPQTGAGVPGALARALDGRRLASAVSVGAGSGTKEMRLVEAGLVERFDLYEISEARCAAGRTVAAEAGLGERVRFHAADAFACDHPAYELVHWDHALHHMMDVRAALEWSVAHLVPGGLLVINDYIGPNRLQWLRAEVDFARAFYAEAAPHLGVTPHIRQKIPVLSRWRQIRRDPSEAPQSELILDACRAACDGFAPEPIGCMLINMASQPVVARVEEGNPALDLLTEWDRKAEAAGMSHFAFGIWRKPD